MEIASNRSLVQPGAVPDPEEAELLEEEPESIWQANEADHQVEYRRQRQRRTLAVLVYLITVVVCLALGALWARQRYRAQKIIASINGQIITQDAFMHRMEVATGSDTLLRMANEMLQDQYAKKMGVTVTQSEVDARYKLLSSKPDFPRYLANTHQSVEDVIYQLRNEMTVNKIIARQVKVSEADVALYYRAMSDPKNLNARFYTPPRVSIAVIASRNKERIVKAKQELVKGADFATVAAAYSDDRPSKDHGGELPPITRGRTPYSKVPGMEKIIFDMKEGETVGPVLTGPTWSLFRCLKQEAEVIQPREQVDYECRVGAMMARLPKATAAQIHADYLKFQQSAMMHAFRPEYIKVLGGR